VQNADAVVLFSYSVWLLRKDLTRNYYQTLIPMPAAHCYQDGFSIQFNSSSVILFIRVSVAIVAVLWFQYLVVLVDMLLKR